METVTKVQILNEVIYILLRVHACWKSMNLSVLHAPNCYQIIRQASFLRIGEVTNRGEENLEFKPAFIIIIIAIIMDIPDRLSPHLHIVHCFRRILRAISRIGTGLLYVGSNWTSCLCSSMWRGPQEYTTRDLVPTSPAGSHVSGSSNFDSFRDGW